MQVHSTRALGKNLAMIALGQFHSESMLKAALNHPHVNEKDRAVIERVIAGEQDVKGKLGFALQRIAVKLIEIGSSGATLDRTNTNESVTSADHGESKPRGQDRRDQ